MASVLALAGYSVPANASGGTERAGSGGRPTSPPPFFPEVRPLLQQADYSITFPPPAITLTPQVLLRAATAHGSLDAAASEMEHFVRALGPSDGSGSPHGSDADEGQLEASLLQSLLEQVDAHADVSAALKEAENAAATGAQVPQAAIMAKLVGVSNRLFAASRDASSVGAQLRSYTALALHFVKTASGTPGGLFDDMHHPAAWAKHLEQMGALAETGRLDRMISSTAEATILALQNEHVTKSNASHARAAERVAAAARHAAELAERREREERERIELRAKEAENRARERAARAERVEQERLRKIEEEAERKQRADQAHQERIDFEQAKAAEAEAEAAISTLDPTAMDTDDETSTDVAPVDQARPAEVAEPAQAPVAPAARPVARREPAEPAAVVPERRSTRKRRRTVTGNAAEGDEDEEEEELADAPVPPASRHHADDEEGDQPTDEDATDDDALPLSSFIKNDDATPTTTLDNDDDSLPLSSLVGSALAQPASTDPPTTTGRSLRSKKQKL